MDYYGHSRREIEPLLPDAPARILEIGCSAGGTLAWLREKWPDAEIVGVDGYAPALPKIKEIADVAIIQDLEEPLPDLGKFDLILALDILEHLRDPISVLQSLANRLTDNGRVIVSIPNVAHYSVSLNLLLRRRFEYQDAGILDRTHLRFFTESSAKQLIEQAGLSVTAGVVNGLEGRKTSILNLATLGFFRHYFVKQYIIAGDFAEVGGRFQWQRRHTQKIPAGGTGHRGVNRPPHSGSSDAAAKAGVKRLRKG